MSEFLRVDYLRFILLFIIVALILAFVGLIQEVKLKNRSKINYHNFEIYKKYYQLKINVFYVSTYIVYIIASTIVAMIIVRNSVYGIYALILPVLNVLLFPFIYLQLTRIKLNCDLTSYTMYFQNINRNYYHKLLLSQRLQEVEKTYYKLHNSCFNINNTLKEYFVDFKEIDSLETTLMPIIDIIRNHQLELANFDDSYPNKFNHSLSLYLTTGVHHKLVIEEFTYKANYSLKKLVESIKNAQILAIYNYSLKNIIDKKIININKLITVLLSLNVNLDDKFIIEVLKYISDFPEERKILINDLTKNQLISLNVLCEYINVHDLAWVYEDILINHLDKKDYVKIFSSMIINDAYNSAQKLLGKIDDKKSFYITKTLSRELQNNNTYKLFSLYKKIHSTGNFFNLKAVKYENLAIAIANFFKDYFPRDVDAPLINDIIHKRAFENHKAKIETVYERIQKGYHKLFTTTMNTILIYSKSKCTSLDYINYEKVIIQYAHYRKNLNLNELRILDELLIALILLNEDDKAIINELYQNLYQSNISYSLSNITLSYENRVNVGRKIINNLTNNHLNIFRTVIYSIENDRLVLDKFLNI